MADYQEYRRRVLHRRWRRRFMAAGLLFLLVLLGVWALFLLFTFRAPDLAVFVDPLTGMRGIG